MHPNVAGSDIMLSGFASQPAQSIFRKTSRLGASIGSLDAPWGAVAAAFAAALRFAVSAFTFFITFARVEVCLAESMKIQLVPVGFRWSKEKTHGAAAL